MNDEDKIRDMFMDMLRQQAASGEWVRFDNGVKMTQAPVIETWQQHQRRLLKDWEPHYNEKSSEKYFINLINLMCAGLRNRGLYCRLDSHDTERAVILVSYDRPGAKEQKFVLVNEDGINFRWYQAVHNWRDL